MAANEIFSNLLNSNNTTFNANNQVNLNELSIANNIASNSSGLIINQGNNSLGNTINLYDNLSTIFFPISELVNEYIKINEYINYEKNILSDDANALEIIYFIPNTSVNRLSLSDISQIKNYKNNIINNTYNKIDSLIKNIISLDNTRANYLKDKIKSNLDNINNIRNNLETGLKIRENQLKQLNFTQNLIDICENKSNHNINVIHNTVNKKLTLPFYENLTNFNTNESNIFDATKKEYSVRKNIDINKNHLKNYLLIDFDNENTNNFDLEESGLIIQLFINMTRGLCTLMPNCLIKDENAESLSFNFAKNNLINIINENEGYDIWESVSTLGFDYIEYIKKNKEILKNLSKAYLENNFVYEVSGLGIYNNIKNINEIDISRLNYNFNKISNYRLENSQNSISLWNTSQDTVNDNLIDFVGMDKIVNYYNEYTGNDLSVEDMLIFNHPAESLQKLLSGKYYDVNLKTYSNAESESSSVSFKAHIITDRYATGELQSANGIPAVPLKGLILRHNQFPGIENVIKKFIDKNYDESFVNKYYEQIFVNKKPLYSFKDLRISNTRQTVAGTFEDAEIVQNDPSLVKFTIDESVLNNNNKNLDANILSLKIDSLIKTIKLKNLEKLSIDLKLFEQITNNIKKSQNKNVMLSFSKDDEENISIINQKDDLFDILFTKSNNEDSDYNSNFSLNTDIKVYKNKYKNILNNSEINISNIKNNTKDLFKVFSNYYTENCFITSSYFLKTVIKDTINFVENLNASDYVASDFITHSLYFNYFNDKNKEFNLGDDEVKKIVAKRFIKNAIKNDIISSRVIKQNDLKEFKYNNKLLEDDNIDFTNATNAEKLIAKHQNSSFNLNMISNTIFSSDNLSILSQNYRYSQVLIFTKDIRQKFSNAFAIESRENFVVFNNQVVNITENGLFKASMNITELFFESIVSTNMLPFIHVIDSNYITNTDTKNLHNYTLFPLKKEMYTKNTDNSWFFTETNKKKITNKNISFDLFVVKNESDLGIINRAATGNNLSEEERQKYDTLQKVFIQDNFEKLCNKENDIFNKIENKIKIMLRTVVKDYLKIKIEKESDIDDVINNNKFILDYVSDIVEIYSIFYDNLIERITTNYSMQKFSQYSQHLDFKKLREKIYVSGEDYLTLTDILSYEYNVDKFKEIIKDNSNNFINNFNTTFNTEFLINDYYKLLDKYENDYESFIREKIELKPFDLNEGYQNSFINGDSFSLNDIFINNYYNTNQVQRANISATPDVFIKKIEDVFNILINSESFEMLNLDMIRTFLITLENVSENKNKIFNSYLTEAATSLKFSNSEFFDKINNSYFQNLIMKYIAKTEIKNFKIYNEVYNKINDQNVLSYFENNKLFDFYQNTKTFNENSKQFYKKDIFSINVKYENIKNIKSNSLVKVTLLPKDLYDNNKIYLPKTMIFSLNLTDLNTKMLSNQNVDSEIVHFEKDIDIRFSRANLIRDNNFTGLKHKIKDLSYNYFKYLDSESSNLIDQMSKDIYKNHYNSSIINDAISLSHGIDLFKKDYIDVIEIGLLLQNISDKEFSQIYSSDKETFINKMSEKSFSLEKEFGDCYTCIVENTFDIDKESYDKYIFEIDLNDLPFFYKKDIGANNFKPYTLSARKIRDLHYENINISKLKNLYVDTWVINNPGDDQGNNSIINYSVKIEMI